MPSIRFYVSMIVASVVLFLCVFFANEWLWGTRLQFLPGIGWIYLPAGIRLLCTLLFGSAGAIGILIASWISCFFYLFPDDPLRSFAGGIASAAAPYLVYRLARHLYGLEASLANLSGRRLLLLALAYSFASPALHHFWMLLHGEAAGQGFFVMVLGDLLGTLIVIYAIKGLLAFVPIPRPNVR